MVLYELSKGCTNTAMLFHMHSSISHVITYLGTDEQKRRYGEIIRSGKIIASYASENTSSLHGVWRMETKAISERRRRITGINGRNTSAPWPRGGLLRALVQLEGEEDLTKSLGLLIAPSDNPGFKIDQEWNSFAMRGTMSHSMIYDDVKIPVEDLVGRGGDPIRPDVLPKFGFGYSAVYLGAGGGAFDWVVNYAQTRKLMPDNVPIASYPAIQRQIGEMKIALEGAILMLQRAGWMINAHGADKAYGAINEAKYVCAEASAFITEKAIKVAGGPGLFRHNPLQRFHREARAGLIMPPNTEKCLELTAKTVLEGSANMLGS